MINIKELFGLFLSVILNSKPSASNDLWVMPETFVDIGKPYLEFTCGAYLSQGDALIWYKPHPAGDHFTKFVQKQANGYETTTLLWPLQIAQNNSKIYCAKETPTIKQKQGVFISFQPIKEVLDNNWGPWVWPKTTIIDSIANYVDLTCWAYLYENKVVTWYQKKGDNIKTLARKQQTCDYGYVKLQLRKYLEPSDDDTTIYCGSQSRYESDKMAETEKITLKYRENGVADVELSPQLTPRNYTDDGKFLLDFSCQAYLNATDLLSWFHVKDSNTTERIETVQAHKSGFEHINLLKALHTSDNGTYIYCARESLLPKGNLTVNAKTELIPILFQEEKPYITVKPSTEVIIYKDKDILSFVCGGSEPINKRYYTWYIQGPQLHEVELQQYINESKNYLELRLDRSYHESQLYCAQGYSLKINLTDGRSKYVGYGELIRSHNITFLHQGSRSLNYPDNPQVSPKTFTDNHKPYMEFSCIAFLGLGEVLSWYQIKGPDQSEITLLSLIQQDKTAEWMKLDLNKTLEQSDNDSHVYCAKQNVIQDGNFLEGLKSQLIRIRIQDIKQLETFIKIEPNTDVTFEVNSSLRFSCTGSVPIDGRSYTWFKIDTESKMTIPEQSQATPESAILELALNESYHHNQIFCAQVYVTKLKAKNISMLTHYGALVTSNKITLLLRGRVEYGMYTMVPAIVIPLAILVVAGGVVAYVLRRRRPHPSPRTADKDENLYANVSRDMASTQVTYAVLQFPGSSAGRRTNPQMVQGSEYATIDFKTKL